MGMKCQQLHFSCPQHMGEGGQSFPLPSDHPANSTPSGHFIAEFIMKCYM